MADDLDLQEQCIRSCHTCEPTYIHSKSRSPSSTSSDMELEPPTLSKKSSKRKKSLRLYSTCAYEGSISGDFGRVGVAQRLEDHL